MCESEQLIVNLVYIKWRLQKRLPFTVFLLFTLVVLVLSILRGRQVYVGSLVTINCHFIPYTTLSHSFTENEIDHAAVVESLFRHCYSMLAFKLSRTCFKASLPLPHGLACVFLA